MIVLKSLKGKDFCLNSELIYKIEEGPDTLITLIDGKVMRVAENTEEIIQLIVDYKRRIHLDLAGGQ